jgi:uncharacterized repeat protein (TIGR03803 family)
MVAWFCVAATITASAQGVLFTTLAGFDGTNGSTPAGSLVQARDGNFYGTTSGGGGQNAGTAFRMTPAGTLSTLRSFIGENGKVPYSGLMQASDGNFYGTTVLGGEYTGGVVFKLTPTGLLTVLYNFCSQPNCSDGAETRAGLVQGSDGNLYGTAFLGGASNNPCPVWTGNGCGTVFQLTLAGTLTTLYNFCAQPNCSDGANPYGALVQGSDGNFYGTAQYGGDLQCDNTGFGCGTIFKITAGGEFTLLHTFSGADGAAPMAALVQGRDGNFYGTASGGGTHNSGTIFKITSDGVLTTLYNFCAQPICADGSIPETPLLQASDGNFYGTTGTGGAHGFGVIYKISSVGGMSVVHTFCEQLNCPDGGWPQAGVIQAGDGYLYGTASIGGPQSYASGTIFRLGIVHACATCSR